MPTDVVLQVENLWKQYRLGLVGTGTIKDDLARFWAKLRGKEDPTLKIGEANDRQTIAGDYVWALQDINFEVKQGEVLGIIGKNGAGKSTLLKILSRVTQPTQGQIKMKGRVASLLEVGTGFHPELTGRENIFLNGAILGMSKSEIRSKFDEIVDFSGIGKYIDTPVKRYSSGMYVRLAFAVAAHLEPEILIIDEVLAVGDAEFQKKCLGKMKDVSGEGRTVLFVSHNLAAIKQMCSRAIYLKSGMLQADDTAVAIVNQYLGEHNFLTNDQEIPDDAPRTYNTGEAKFRAVYITDLQNQKIERLAYRQPFRIHLWLEVFKPLTQAIVTIALRNSFDEAVASISDNANGQDYVPRDFEPGLHQVSIEINSTLLLPNTLYLCLGISDFATGGSYDWIENIFKLQIDALGQDKNDDYPWATVHGYVYIPTKWIYQKQDSLQLKK